MTKSLNYNIYLGFFLFVLVVLFLRIGDINFIDGRYLWAEDGNVFISQALSLGLGSIFNPHAGYLHFYPRLISIFAVQIDLVFLPTIFFLAWLGAILYSCYIIFKWLYKQTDSIVTSIIIPLLILCQPNSGEVFFTITNAQWFLALSLIILLIDKEYKVNYKNFLIFILLGLTGPFSILILPILFINIMFKKDIKENYLKYLILVVTALIQIYFMIQSNRIDGEIDNNIIHWLKSVYIFLTFETQGIFIVFSLLIWIIIFVYIIKVIYNIRNQELTILQINGLLLLISLIMIYLAGLWSTKQFPLELHPLGGGSRYFVIPYSLFLISLPLLIKHSRVLYIVLFLVCIIEIKQFTIVNKQVLNFQNFVWFSKYYNNFNIPISPQWSSFPGPSIQIDNIKEKKNIQENIQLFNVKSLEINEQNIKIPEKCKSKNLGIEVYLSRTNDGWSRINYGDHNIKRYFPAGKLIMYFAIPIEEEYEITFYPSETMNINNISTINLFCEDINNNSIKTVFLFLKDNNDIK